ncbi:FUSC family protein [Pseudoruegeria sp. SK021]|uniref:FUSC family protein n=1 Tax=Pseudoruegeria sp. SK021 TaxID=1933035 RepID=UPI001980F6AF|nr:FUSC family protein [Pseudoruegeria sp. SK021]
MTGTLATCLIISLATLVVSSGEGGGTYRSRFRQIAIVAPIAATGYFAGYLGDLPYPVVIAAMAILAFVAGIVSSYGAPFSSAMLQFLLFATLALGLTEFAPYWRPAALYLVGVFIYAIALGCEALILRDRPERRMLADHFEALAELASVRAQDATTETNAADTAAARRKVIDASRTLYGVLLETRRAGRTHEGLSLAATLDAADLVFSALLAETNPDALRHAEIELRAMAAASLRTSRVPLTEQGTQSDQLSVRLAALNIAVSSENRAFDIAPYHAPVSSRSVGFTKIIDRLAVGRSVVSGAAALAICIGLAFASKYVVQANHWYWVPLTVVIVMKPDFGSIFARAVLRIMGTSIGVLIGAGLLVVLPKGMVLVGAIAVLAALLPWTKRLSYWVMVLALTPLVLILLDLVSPGAQTVDFGALRLVDTLIGGGIVLIFGYFIWPRRHGDQITATFALAMSRIADYLVSACAPLGKEPADQAKARQKDILARRDAYWALSNLRTSLARSMSEPPPAGTEAAAWFPIVAGAERLCDRITAHAASRQPDAPQLPPSQVAAAAQHLRDIVEAAQSPVPAQERSADEFLSAIADDTLQISRKLEAKAPLSEVRRHQSNMALRA